MSDGLELLKPFLPGLGDVLEDPEVSEIMINGPHNVWIEGHGKLYSHEAPLLNASALNRAAIHIARPLGLDPATAPIVDARLERRLAGCHLRAARQSEGGYHRAAFWQSGHSQRMIWSNKAHFPKSCGAKPSGCCTPGATSWFRAAPDQARPRCSTRSLNCCPTTSASSPSRTLWSCASSTPICVRFEARGLATGAVTIRDLVRHALRHRPDHIVVGEVRGGEAADLLQALNTGHGGSLTTVHANNAESALSRLASCAMQGGGELPWEVTCRGVVDGIAMVIHMTRREGRRYVEGSAARPWATTRHRTAGSSSRSGGNTMTGRAMTAEEYHRRFADQNIEQIKRDAECEWD